MGLVSTRVWKKEELYLFYKILAWLGISGFCFMHQVHSYTMEIMIAIIKRMHCKQAEERDLFSTKYNCNSTDGRCRCRILFRNRSHNTHFWPLRTKLSNTICSNNNLNSRSWRQTVNHMWSRVSKQTECYRCVMRFIVMVSASASNGSCLQPPLKNLYEKLLFHVIETLI